MKQCFRLFFILLACWALVPGQTFSQEAKGQYASPVFSPLGELFILFEQEGAVHFSHVSAEETSPVYHSQRLLHKPARYPELKTGPGGNIWAVWEGIDGQGSNVFLALQENGSSGKPVLISEGFPGINTSPSLAVDSRGFPWIVWINNFQGSHRVLIFRLETRQSWQVNSIIGSPVATPQISIDSALSVWVFWGSAHRGPGEILCRRLSEQLWSETFALNTNFRFPHLDPNVSLDASGHPWVVWTAYDGEDYEIFHSQWTGARWTPESLLTDNRSLSDLSPSLCFLPGNTAFLAWSQASNGSRICLKQLRNGKWSKTRFLCPIDGFNRRPKIASALDRFAVTWEKTLEGEVCIQLFTSSTRLIEQTASAQNGTPPPRARLFPFRKPLFSQFLPASLEQTRFSGFGDSITYGVVNRTWFPDKGYVPRLDTLIKVILDSFHVINRGIPGEKTGEGLARIEGEFTTYKAKYMLLMEGTNDMSSGVPSQVVAFNIEEMIKKCLQNGVYPYLGTIIPRSDSLWNTGIKERTLTFNSLLEEISSLLRITLTDHYDIFMSYPAGHLALFSDGAHPSEEGYQEMAQAWYRTIEGTAWPPVNLTVERKTDKILFYEEPVNILGWEENPLLSSETEIGQYIIYRKMEEASNQDFAMVAVVAAGGVSFIDRDVSSSLEYSYFILAEDVSGVRGPASFTVSDR